VVERERAVGRDGDELPMASLVARPPCPGDREGLDHARPLDALARSRSLCSVAVTMTAGLRRLTRAEAFVAGTRPPRWAAPTTSPPSGGRWKAPWGFRPRLPDLSGPAGRRDHS